MEDKPVIKRGRGRPRKLVVNTDSPAPVVVAEQIPIKEPEPMVQPEPVEEVKKKERKVNPWVEHCSTVRARPENQGKSYRDILKIAKLDY
jgi:hypothetical protein